MEALSASTAAALTEFLSEQAAKTESGEVIEDWQLSQFWYDAPTARSLAQECLRAAGPRIQFLPPLAAFEALMVAAEGRVAFVCSPTAFGALSASERASHALLEFDARFEALFPGHFVHFDYREPLGLPEELGGAFDVLLADPPFLSKECLAKTAIALRFLASKGPQPAKILLCTGSLMEGLANQLLQLTPTNFKPRHANNLANDFACFANYDCPLES